MLCCNEERKILGMSRVNTQDVVKACNGILKAIYRSRSLHRKYYVEDWLVEADKRWRLFWKWLGFRRPTRKDALRSYYHSSGIPPHFGAAMLCGGQEGKCKDILRIAQTASSDRMWISAEGARACRLGGL